MGGTKIIVLQLKEIIKSVIFAILGLLLIIALIYLFMPSNKSRESEPTTLYIPGTYSSQVTLNNEPLTIEVVVSENEILNVGIQSMADIQTVFYPLIQPTMESLSEEILNTQSLEIPIATENLMTSKLLLEAIDAAIQQAVIPEF